MDINTIEKSCIEQLKFFFFNACHHGCDCDYSKTCYLFCYDLDNDIEKKGL